MGLGLPNETLLNGGDLRSPSTPAPRRTGGTADSMERQAQTTSPFTPVPQYSNMGAYSGWQAPAAQNQQGGYLQGVAGNSLATLTGGAYDPRRSIENYYAGQFTPQQMTQAKASGMDPAVFAMLGPRAQELAGQWGTNLGTGRAASSVDAQVLANQQQQQQRGQTNAFIDEFGALQDVNALNLQNQYQQGIGMANARYGMAKDALTDNLYNDLGIMGQQRFRAVDLARDDNRAALLHNANMRGVLDTSRGLVGQDFARQQGFLNDQIGFLNERQNLAYDQFRSTDEYGAQQARDLMAQYGFAGEQFAQNQQEAFANRNTQQRAATSDAAARGAFGSAGFGDNIQDIYGQYERNMDANTLQLDRTNQSIDERNRDIGQQRKDLRIGYEGQRLGFRQDARGLNNQHDINRISTEGQYNQLKGQYSANDLQRANLQNVDKGLSSLAKEYGLREQDLKNGFNQAVDKLGLDLNETTNQLGQMLNSGNANLQAQAMQFMQQTMAYQ